MAKLPRRPDFQKRPLGPPGPPEKFDRERWQAEGGTRRRVPPSEKKARATACQARHSGLENYIGCVAWNYRDIQAAKSGRLQSIANCASGGATAQIGLCGRKLGVALSFSGNRCEMVLQAQMRDEAHVDADARVAAWQRHFRLSDLSTARTAGAPVLAAVVFVTRKTRGLPSLQARPERPRDRSLERHAVPSEELVQAAFFRIEDRSFLRHAGFRGLTYGLGQVLSCFAFAHVPNFVEMDAFA
ncbi:hypothetical protein AK812_SmicGene28373 [Symbiodinium microadriaticum]|uniref:Uncharacterized protein n=1 Tax=Symbiodinium microadriaticum TaxID=2951 RepID=A0A1Q9D4S3_SYMMI|nr:hypothetical protein AK812_SmicGene28373 [Symbiodinium microadriaticum]